MADQPALPSKIKNGDKNVQDHQPRLLAQKESAPKKAQPLRQPDALLKQIEAADTRINDLLNPKHRGQRPIPDPIVGAWSARGALRQGMGFAESGLEDLLRAAIGDRAFADKPLPALLTEYDSRKGKEPKSGPINAQLGEALRVHARDVLLKDRNRANELNQTIERSIACFDRAETSFNSDLGTRAWVRAHCGAVHTMKFWISHSLNQAKSLDSFKEAEENFKAAEGDYAAANGGATYEWSLRFLAFLYAIRGSAGDFGHAIDELKKVTSPDKLTQSSIKRGLVMVNSYIAGSENSKLPERESAAMLAIENGKDAFKVDSEDFLAAYFTASSLYWLATNTPGKDTRASRMAAVGQAIKSARLRAMDIVSQAYVALAGLDVLTALTADDSQAAKAAATRARNILSKFGDKPGEDFDSISPDLETRAIFSRDPTFQLIKNQKNGTQDDIRRCKDVYAILGGHCDCEELVRRFAVQ